MWQQVGRRTNRGSHLGLRGVRRNSMFAYLDGPNP
jgi:hypothetical protein